HSVCRTKTARLPEDLHAGSRASNKVLPIMCSPAAHLFPCRVTSKWAHPSVRHRMESSPDAMASRAGQRATLETKGILSGRIRGPPIQTRLLTESHRRKARSRTGLSLPLESQTPAWAKSARRSRRVILMRLYPHNIHDPFCLSPLGSRIFPDNFWAKFRRLM